MMKKLHIQSLLLLVLLIIIAGCSGNNNTETTTRSGAQGNPFVGGTDGLEVTFLAGAPPPEVFDQDEFPFDINIKVENVGEADVRQEDAVFRIVGINPTDFGVKQADLIQRFQESILRGSFQDAQGNQIDGTISNVEYPTLSFVDEVKGAPEFIIRAEACYRYRTQAVAQLCILEDLIGRTRKTEEIPVCEPFGDKTSFNSGSPLHITNVQQNVAGRDKISFSFNIKHVGGPDNRIFQPGSVCESEQISNKDKVFVRVNTGLSGTECTGLSDGDTPTEGFVKLFGESSGSEQRSIFCTVPLERGRSDFEKQIEFLVEFDYKETALQQTILVRHTDIFDE